MLPENKKKINFTADSKQPHQKFFENFHFSYFLGIKSEISDFDEKTVFLEEIFKDSITKFHGNKIKKFCF